MRKNREDKTDETTAGDRRQRPLLKVLSGVALLFACHVIAAIALAAIFFSSRWAGWYLVASLALGALVLFGIAQVFYAMPLALWLQRKRRFGALKGVAIGAFITIVLNIGALFYVARFANASV